MEAVDRKKRGTCSISILLLVVFWIGCEQDTSSPKESYTEAGTPTGTPIGSDASQCPSKDLQAADLQLPRNLILIMGDGMGAAHIEAGRTANQGKLYLDTLNGPVLYHTNSRTTYADPDQIIPSESAASMTAVATGIRVENGVLSVDAFGRPLKTVLELSIEQGKSTGLITNSYMLDASPMAWAAHVPHRSMTQEIAVSLLSMTKPDLLFGGWTPDFIANEEELLDLAVEEGYHIISSSTELGSLPIPAPFRVLGLFQVNAPIEVWPEWEWGLTAVLYRDLTTEEPTLKEMSEYALAHLSKNPNGFFLFVENEHLDLFGHIAVDDPERSALAIPPEVLELDQTVQLALEWVESNSSFEETLIVVFSDHECGGYTFDGQDITKATFVDTPNHTNRPVPLYAKGPDADRINSIAHISEIHLLLTGRLSDNGEVACH